MGFFFFLNEEKHNFFITGLQQSDEDCTVDAESNIYLQYNYTQKCLFLSVLGDITNSPTGRKQMKVIFWHLNFFGCLLNRNNAFYLYIYILILPEQTFKKNRWPQRMLHPI